MTNKRSFGRNAASAPVVVAVLAFAWTSRAAVVVGADPPAGGDPGAAVTPTPGAVPPGLTPPQPTPRQLRRQQRAAARAAAAAAATNGQPAPTVAAAPIQVPTPAPPPPPTTTTTTTTTTTGEVAGEKEFNSCRKFPAGKRIVKLNLKPDTELGDLIAWISSITCKEFLLPGTIPANSKKVTIVAPQLITPEEAYRLFLGALDSVGLTVVPSGKFLRIIETPKAKTMPTPVSGDNGELPGGDIYVTRLVRVENSDANEVAQVLGRLKGEQGDVVVYPPQGALIITDTSANISRMLKILHDIDQPATGEKVWMISVKNMAATEMAQKLGEIFQVAQLGRGGAGRGAPPPGAPPPPPGARNRASDLAAEMTVSKIIPDERSNQLIVIANERTYYRVLTLVKRLDVPLGLNGEDRIHIYYCENANCDELAATLGAVTGVAVTGVTGGRARAGRTQPNQPPPPTPGAPQQGAATGANALFEGEVRINFDRPTNSLLVVSSLKDYQSLRQVISTLDSPRKQVFVEAMILEVTLNKTRELGASFHGVKPQNLFGLSDPSLIVGGLNPTTTLFPANSLGETMLAGVLGPVLSPTQAQGLGIASTVTASIPSFGVLVKALQTNSDVDVLSNPHILIMNNEEGEISVGSRVPFPVSTLGLGGAGAAGAAGAASPLGGLGFGNLFPQVQREKVALELKLTPHVNEHDMIRLEVDEKISELAPGGDQRLGPSTSERTAKTIVVAKDQQTILIGGLMSDKVINSVTKIPILGDIPILGFFFRNTTKQTVKTNLIIAITPYVIADQSDLRRVLEKKMKERREFIERFGGEERPDIESEKVYRHKVGMLEEINRAAREIEMEEADEEKARERMMMDESGPIELGPIPGPTPANGGGETAPAPAPTTPTPAPAPAPAAAPPAPAPGGASAAARQVAKAREGNKETRRGTETDRRAAP
jgi:general secretion pathway protein D